jgi:hypothetical protein
MSEETDLPRVSLRGFKKLRVLNCQYKILRPAAEEDMGYDEPLEEGFFSAEEHKNIDSEWDVRTILPESLEVLWIHDSFPRDDGQDEWDNIVSVFESPSPSTPNLSWDRTCIRKIRHGVTRETIGGGEEPVPVESQPLAGLLHGHGPI